MSLLIDDIVGALHKKYKTELGLNKIDLERVVDSEFKYILQHLRDRNLKKICLIHLGTINPTKWFKYNKDMINAKRDARIERLKNAEYGH